MTRPAPSRLDGLLWAAALGLAGASCWLSLMGPGANPKVSPGWDTLLLAVVVGAGVARFRLAAVWRPGRGPGRFPRAAPWIVLGAVTLGGLIEILQGSVFDGDPELRDWVADVAGAALGLLVWFLARGASARRGSEGRRLRV